MRIRKNAGKLSTSSPSSLNYLTKTHLNCQLNQSPWDIITFPPSNSDYSPPFPLHHFQVEGAYGFTGNGSSGSSSHSIGANYSDGSVRTFMESEVIMNKVEELDFGDEEEETQIGFKDGEELEEKKMIKEEDDIVLCGETNGKGWQCGRVVKKGHSVCARHMKKGVVSEAVLSKSTETTLVRRGRGRPRINKIKEPVPTPTPTLTLTPVPAKAQEPNEFYYYSGFGPLWGKKKGPGRCTNGDTSGTDRESAKRVAQKNEEIDYMECDDDDDDEDENQEHEIGKKRGRKRIKARSLKSLM